MESGYNRRKKLRRFKRKAFLLNATEDLLFLLFFTDKYDDGLDYSKNYLVMYFYFSILTLVNNCFFKFKYLYLIERLLTCAVVVYFQNNLTHKYSFVTL